MARILTAGFEFGDWMADGFTNYRGAFTTSRNSTFTPTSPGGNRSKYSLALTADQGVEFDLTDPVPGGVDEMYVRMHIHMGNRSDGTWERFRFSTPAGDMLLRYTTIDNGGGSGVGGAFYNAFYNSSDALIVSNSNFTHRNNEWHLLELYVRFAGSGGRITLWFNNVLEMDWTGSLVGPAAETLCGLFRPHYDQFSGGGATTTYYDNIAINDLTGPTNNSRIGDGHIISLVPDAAGTTTNCTNPHGTSVDNFKFVNGTPSLNENGFVAPTAPNDKDTYNLQEPPIEFYGVNAMKVVTNGVRHGSTITQLKGIVKPPAQSEIESPTVVGVGRPLSVGADGYNNFYFENNSNNSNEPYTIDELKDMEAGFQFLA